MKEITKRCPRCGTVYLCTYIDKTHCIYDDTELKLTKDSRESVKAQEKIVKKVFGEDKRDKEDKKLDERIRQSHEDGPKWEDKLAEILVGSRFNYTLTEQLTKFIRETIAQEKNKALDQVQEWLSGDKGGDIDDDYLTVRIDDIEEIKDRN